MHYNSKLGQNCTMVNLNNKYYFINGTYHFVDMNKNSLGTIAPHYQTTDIGYFLEGNTIYKNNYYYLVAIHTLPAILPAGSYWYKINNYQNRIIVTLYHAINGVF